MSVGTVFIVGAGPGDPGLLTVKALELVRTCDVLVYDNLMADECVALSRAAEKIYVGKGSGRHMMTQEAIGEILVDRARGGKTVVRLKGGDPFVFGRGGEECQTLGRASIPFVVVPGVTAGIAGPAYAGIPVTHRDMSRGVTLVTGHFSRDQEVELPWEALAGLGHTLVFYMAVAALERACSSLIQAGLAGDTPAALVEQATTGSQRTVTGTLSTIASLARERDVKPPALLVCGHVVDLQQELHWLPQLPLAGRSVLFTRAADRDYDAVDRLRALGAKVIDVPVVQLVARGDVGMDLASVEAVAFTSAAAVGFFFDLLARQGRDARALAGHVVAAATHTVASELERHGIAADLDLEVVRSLGLARALKAHGVGGPRRVLLPRSAAAGADLVTDLERAGLEPVTLVLYDTLPADLGWLEVKLAGRSPDAVVFLSGSGVAAVLAAVPALLDLERPPLWACVGRLSAQALESRGIVPDVLPTRPDVDMLVDDLVEKMGSQP
ncbi:MAG: uroporphyrinogen-III C-methyltransferase [Deltaproteobacteria bacterium]|nr:uroporphyrinogen-III C-methyltransferase [Deltaproteobacteria bacterium]